MQINLVKRIHKLKTRNQIGRGGKRGKTSGRGTKGQKARSGRKIRPEMRDVIKRVPKLRGYFFKGIQAPVITVDLSSLESSFKPGEAVNPKELVSRGVISLSKGKMPKIKILSGGELTKAFIITGCDLSAGARKKIETAGGKIQ